MSNRVKGGLYASEETAGRLAERHFTMQDTDTVEMSHLDVVALDPLLRGLLFTDGTVTRTLEAQTLCDVSVDLVEQSRVSASSDTARFLEVATGATCLQRRVAMTTDGETPVVWAESHMITERLPTDFVTLLEGAPQGIGASLERSRLESRRELLWFRLGEPPAWARTHARSVTALIRLYRIITNNLPALLICESFAVQRRSGVYRPLGWSEDDDASADGVLPSALL